MNSFELGFGIRLFMRSQRVMRSLIAHLEALHSGVAMGLVSDSDFEVFDTYPFNELVPRNLHDTAAAGLEVWERDAIVQYFENAESLLLIAAGEVREMLSLQQCGKSVTGVEYSQKYTQLSNAALVNLGGQPTIRVAQRYELPHFDQLFDSVFIGRKFYSLLHDRTRRIQFLRHIRCCMPGGAPLLLSYFIRNRDTLAFRYQAAIANVIRSVRQDPNRVEVGDHIDPETPVFHHHFTLAEIKQELHEGGFRLEQHGESWFGYAIAQATESTVVNVPESSLAATS